MVWLVHVQGDFRLFPQQQNALLGVFAQYRFRCVLGELGRFREGTGCREPVPGWRVIGFVPVWTEPFLGNPGYWEGSGFRRSRSQGSQSHSVAKVDFCTLKVCSCTLKLHFCTLKVYWCTLKVYWCTLKVYFCTFKEYFCTSKVYFCTLKVYFCTLKVYICMLKVTFALWKCAFGRWKYTFVLCKYTLYFATMLGQRKHGN